MSDAVVSMLTYRDGLLGGSVALQGQSISVQPFYVHSESTPKEREALLKDAAEIKFNSIKDKDYE